MASRRRPTILEPEAGGNAVIVAWRGLYHIFGARADSFEVTPTGVRITNLKFPDKYDSATIIRDLSVRNDKVIRRRLDLIPLYFWINGEAPEPFHSALEMTAWMVANLKGAGEDEGRSPKYAKDAINEYKIENGMYVPRGRPRKTFSLEKLGELNAAALSDVEESELEALKAKLDSVLSEKTTEPVEA
jgi:hypothetical protein